MNNKFTSLGDINKFKYSPSPLSHCQFCTVCLLTRSIIFDINFLQSSQHIAPYFLGCLRVVMELHTTHTRDFVKIADDRFDEELGELSLRENGLLIKFESLSCDPNILKFVESCNTGFLRIDVERLFESLLLSVDSTDNAGAVVDEIDVDGDSFDGSFGFVDLISNSSTKLKPRIQIFT